MDQPTPRIQTSLLDLTHLSLSELRSSDPVILAPATERMLRQVDRHRYNIGGDPPGRVD
jgi:hypothetical protein